MRNRMKKQVLGRPSSSFVVPRPPQRRQHWAPCAAESVAPWQAAVSLDGRAERARLALGIYEGSHRIYYSLAFNRDFLGFPILLSGFLRIS